MELDEQISWLENLAREACQRAGELTISTEESEYWRRMEARIDEVLAS